MGDTPAAALLTAGSMDLSQSGDTSSPSPRSANNHADVNNSDVDWDAFDPEWYLDHNYRSLRDDDQQIIELVRDFFGAANAGGRGLDVGSGSNLYPAFAMLPFCDQIDLREYSAANVKWLDRQIASFGENWDDFWALFQKHPAYGTVPDPRAALRRVAAAQQASVFDLPRAQWNIGTMFFVACSLSTDLGEFEQAVHCFVRALVPDAPFAAAFMVKSEGYPVGDTWFPAVAIGSEEVKRCLAPVAYDVRVEPIDTGSPLRDGYGGMILALGRATG